MNSKNGQVAPIPKHGVTPIISNLWQQAFRVKTLDDVYYQILQQFERRELAFRELGQNSQDAAATKIRVDYKFENEMMFVSFWDNGEGMDIEVIQKNYLTLFDSSKEGVEGKVGVFSIGRISVLVYKPQQIVLYTLAKNHSGYKLVIEGSNLAGKLYELSPKRAKEIIGSSHGTLFQMWVPCESEKAFVEEVKKANACIERELQWISSQITITTVEMDDNSELKFSKKSINKTMEVPGEYTTTLKVKLSSGRGEACISIGLESKNDNNLASITLCKGKIPIERPSGLPWTGGEDFHLLGTQIIIDSFQFETSFGRNKVKRNQFTEELFPKVFEHLFMERLVRTVARLYSESKYGLRIEYEESARNMIADVLVKAKKYGFKIPNEVFSAPFIPNFNSVFKAFSIDDLDKAEVIYYTFEKTSPLNMREDIEYEQSDDEDSPVIIISLSGLSWDFRREFLELRYANKLQEKKNRFFIQEAPELASLSAKIERRVLLGCSRTSQFPMDFSSLMEVFYDDCSLPGEISIAHFYRYDRSIEKKTRTFYTRDSSAIFFNYNNDYIQNLIDLMFNHGQKYADLAAHLMMREVIFNSATNLPSLMHREQALTQDILQRLGKDGTSKLSALEKLLNVFYSEEEIEC